MQIVVNRKLLSSSKARQRVTDESDESLAIWKVSQARVHDFREEACLRDALEVRSKHPVGWLSRSQLCLFQRQ
jgi:hypothetical protein